MVMVASSTRADAAACPSSAVSSFSLGDDRPEAGTDQMLPGRKLLVAQDLEPGPTEHRPIVVDRIDPQREPGDSGSVQLERHEHEPAAGPQDPRHLLHRFGLVRGVLQGVDRHDHMRGLGGDPGLLEAALCELGAAVQAED